MWLSLKCPFRYRYALSTVLFRTEKSENEQYKICDYLEFQDFQEQCPDNLLLRSQVFICEKYPPMRKYKTYIIP